MPGAGARRRAAHGGSTSRSLVRAADRDRALSLARIAREPLLHFALFGALLFALHGWLRGPDGGAAGAIVVDGPRIDSLVAGFERVWQRPPTAAERAGLIETFVREEVLYREGLAMGLDRDDPVIRRRIGQKMAFLAGGLAPQAPTRAELQAWLDAHPADYAIEARYDVEQRYFDPQRRGAALAADLDRARALLERGAADPGGVTRGDATLLPASLQQASASAVARTFGADFAAALEGMPVGVWQGPVRSSYGVHLVRIVARAPARAPALDEVAAAVERDLLRARGQEAEDDFYRTLRDRYDVRIEDPGPDAASVAPGGSEP